MSEYQYYEFMAIDRPLTVKEQAELRAISTRAEITSTCFQNEYHWGDLNANPNELLLRYFDAHVYVANWSGWQFCLRLPAEAISKATGKLYASDDTLQLTAKGKYWLLTWQEQESDDYDRYSLANGEGWMAKLVALRKEILAGDLRPLYLGWLAAASAGELDDDEREPPLPPGMDKLSAAQRALVDFLGIDPDWLTAAGSGAETRITSEPAAQVEAFLATLSSAELRAGCRQLLMESSGDGEGLAQQFARWQRAQVQPASSAQRRTLATLQQLAETAGQTRRQCATKSAAQARKRAQERRAKQLAELAADMPAQWRKLDALADLATKDAYLQAIALLLDLRDAYTVDGSRAEFDRKLQHYLARYSGRQALHRRVREAGLTGRASRVIAR